MRSVSCDLSMSAAWADALFASTLQRSDEPSAVQVKQAIAAARQSGKSAAVAAAAQAEQELKFIWDAIRVQEKYKHDDLWSPAEFDVYRWLIARQIMAIAEVPR